MQLKVHHEIQTELKPIADTLQSVETRKNPLVYWRIIHLLTIKKEFYFKTTTKNTTPLEKF